MLAWLRTGWKRRSKGRVFLAKLQDAVRGPRTPTEALEAVLRKFSHFKSLLEKNKQALKVMSDLEEKVQGEYLFDINYFHSSLDALRTSVRGLIEDMVALGGGDYAVLRGRCAAIEAEVEQILSGGGIVGEDAYIIPFDELRADREWSVGAKNAGLGEMRALGLPVPDGFAVSAWAYKSFIDDNDLRQRIAQRIASLDIKDLDGLQAASREIRGMVTSSPVPEDLADGLRRNAAALAEGSSSRSFSLRSSALSEDSSLSFAGQYVSLLNVRPEEVVERYREVLAGKFTPRAIYYLLSHSLSEALLAMSVGAVSMVDASASGVVYTCDPVSPEDGSLLVNAVLGQGKYLVDGTLTPDVFRISRDDLSLLESHVARKPVRLVTSAAGGLTEDAVPEAEQERPSLPEESLKELARMALEVEAHCDGPRDIEWALDREGRLLLLQNRPLRVMRRKAAADASLPDLSDLEVLLSEGITICPGAAGGAVAFAASPEDLPSVPEGAVLAVSHPFPEIITVMGRIKAIVTRAGGVASHMATLAREYGVPTMVLSPQGLERGWPVTVDATAGVVYKGICDTLIRARKEESEPLDAEPIFNLAKRILAKVSPLNLIHPTDPGFTAMNCRTFHDITRFAHQRALEEMFASGRDIARKDKLGLPLDSEIPLPVTIIYLDEELSDACRGRKSIGQDDLLCEPMKAFWAGIRKEGWPKPPAADLRGLTSVMGTHMTSGRQSQFLEKSYALLGREYMLLSLKMGYHFSTVEAMSTPELSKNYIRMQYMQGGAAPTKRARRIKLIETLLSRAGFQSATRGDFLETRISYQSREDILERLFLLGRLAIMTKQLDMALGNDRIVDWYIRDFSERLDLPGAS